MEKRTCKFCSLSNEQVEWRKTKGKDIGYICKACHNSRHAERSKRRYSTVEGRKARTLTNYKYNASEKGKETLYRLKHCERFKNIKVRSTLKWVAANKGRKLASCKRYLFAKTQRVPSWANLQQIAAIYANCPKGYHVDHIIPLQGKLVSGLHCELNLQYLPAIDNIVKSNSFDTITFVGP